MTPALSIITGTRNRPESFARFWKSLVASASVPTEVVIGDACDGPEPSKYVRDIAVPEGNVVGVKVNVQRPRLGMVKGYNAGFRMASAPLVAWFNDDCELTNGWDRTAIDFMERYPEVGCGCIYWRDPNGRFYVQEWHGLVYANFGIVRREAGEQVGWFEDRSVFVPAFGRTEGITFYGCDTGFALKLIDAGWGVVPIPRCTVEHYRELDKAREETMQEHNKNTHLPGAVLDMLWGGAPGFERLRQLHAKFDHLKQPIFME